MARYRQKSEEELVNNAMRRAETARVRLKHAYQAERELNETLPVLQAKVHEIFSGGNVPELDYEHETWIRDTLEFAAEKAHSEDQPRPAA